MNGNNILHNISSGLQGFGGAIKSGFEGANNAFFGGIASLSGNAPQQTSYGPSATIPVQQTSTGGVAFNPSHAQAYNTQASTPAATTPSKPDLSSFILHSNNTPAGTLSTTGANPTGYSPNAGYSIDTSSIPSNALGGGTSYADVQGQHQSYMDYVNALAAAQGYSPQYIQAQQGVWQGQANAANIAQSLYTGSYPGQTMNQVQVENAASQALNTQKETEAQITLAGQQLARTGNIAAAQTQLAYNPTSISSQNAINQYNALQHEYPSAGIPAFNPQGDPLAQQQMAQGMVAGSPQFQSQFLHQYATPGGGTGLYSTLQTSPLQHNPDGTISLVSGAAASLGSASQSALSSAVSTYNSLAPAYKAANDDFTAMNQFMQSAGINDQNIPIINQIENKAKAGLIDPGAVAAFQTYIQSLRANYTQLLGARGETPTAAGDAAQQLIPDTLNVPQMQQVQQALNTNGGNIINATGQQIQSILGSLNTGQPNTNFNTQPQAGGWGSLGD